MSSGDTMLLQVGKSITQLLISVPFLAQVWLDTTRGKHSIFRLEQSALRFCDCGGAGEQLPAAGYVFTYRFTN